MLTHQDAIKFAGRAGWASRVPAALRDALLRASRYRTYSAQAPVFGIGDGPGPVFFIAAGSLAAEAAPSVTPPHKVMLLYPGTWIAEGAVMPERRVVGFVATRPSALLLVDNTDIRRIASAQPDLWRCLAQLSLENHYDTMGLAHELMIRGGRRRLAALLARLAGLRDEVRPDPLLIDATQAEVAEIANLARSVVSSFLKEMERDGIVRLGWSSIEILRPDRLLELAGSERC